ncbi:hypothetical protein DL96DRAFT_1624007 [Flagelloscypha sp. PMI_526]|nr:hypothetical protein DL96DRAFT_1624007 [Flagelloscypha sp. PMI_526]
MAPVELPFDILNRLIDLVDRQSLLSCALSSRVLRGPCQKILFATWTYLFTFEELSEVSERWTQFGKALNTSSNLGQHVTSLAVRAVLLTDETIVSVFSKTVNLSNLVIQGERRMSRGKVLTEMPWLNLQPQTRRLLLQDVFPRLTNLRLSDIDSFPAIIIESLSSIEHLECSDHVTPLPNDFSPAPQTIEKPHPLLRLSLRQSRNDDKMIDYTPFANFVRRHQCRIQEISFRQVYPEEVMDQSTLSSLAELLASSKTTLQALSFGGPDSFLIHLQSGTSYNSWFNGVYNLGQYTALTTFIINLVPNDLAEVTGAEYVQRLADILQSGRPTANSAGLRIVAINADLDPDFVDIDEVDWWGPIVHALSTIPTLQKIFFKIEISAFDDNQAKDIHNESKTALEDALKGVGLLEKSEIACEDDLNWNLSIHSS